MVTRGDGRLALGRLGALCEQVIQLWFNWEFPFLNFILRLLKKYYELNCVTAEGIELSRV